MFTFILIFLGFNAHAFEVPLEGMTGAGRPARTVLQYQGQFASDQSVSGQKGNFQVPVWRSDTDSLSAGVRVGRFDLEEDLALPNSTLLVPRRLDSTEVNFSYGHRRTDKEAIGTRVSIGSASDKTFSGTEVTSLAASVFWVHPSETNPQAQWIWSLNYSNNNSFTTLPIPGVAYMFTEPGLIGIFGLPFAFVRWNPSEGSPWTLSGFYLLTTLKLEAAYGPPFMNAFTRFEWGQETWLRADREIREDRLSFDEKKFLFGGRLPLTKWLFAEAFAGWAFDRKFFEGRSIFRKRTGDARLDDVFVFGANLRASF